MESPGAGGRDAVVDCREVYRLLDPHLKERFARQRFAVVRNYIEGLDVSWQSFFQTTDKAAVKAYCRQASMDFDGQPQQSEDTTSCPGCSQTSEDRRILVLQSDTNFTTSRFSHPMYATGDIRVQRRRPSAKRLLRRRLGSGRVRPQRILQIYRRRPSASPGSQGDILMLDIC